MSMPQKSRSFPPRSTLRYGPGLLCIPLFVAAALSVPRVSAQGPDSQAAVSAPAPAASIESGVQRWHNRGPVRLLLPDGYGVPRPQHRIFTSRSYQLRLYADQFAQGRAIYVEILAVRDGKAVTRAPENFQAALVFARQSVPLSRHSFGYRGFIGLAPYQATGKTAVSVTAGPAPRLVSATHHFTVSKTEFPVYRSAMDLGKFSDHSTPPDQQLLAEIAAQRARKNAVFNRRGEIRIDDRLAHPRDLHRITSPFWAKRIVERYRLENGQRQTLAPKSSVHGGLDLRAVTGAPIYAVAGGEVALAEAMYYEGNLTMIDHGQGIVSIYMHQDRLGVEAGQLVQAGDEIGKAGATGAVTGAHLHIALHIRRTPVDPLSLLALPVCN
jgi:murein DD-endopeptidase MepM/ murein hydrolase activator NlpD